MGNKQYSLTDYVDKFGSFDKFVNEVNKDPSKQQQKYEGYFIYSQHYDDFHEFVNTKYNEQQNQLKEFHRQLPEPYELSREIQQKKCPTINIEQVNNKISQGYVFKLINKELYEAICQSNEEEKIKNKVFYSITPENLLIWKETEANKQNIQYIFKNNHKKNIIDKSSIQIQNEAIAFTPSTVSEPNEKINRIYIDISNYYRNEEDILTSLKASTQKQYSGYFVDRNWVDKWKQCVNYENIKMKYLKNDEIDRNLLQNTVLDELKKNNSNYDGLSDVKQSIIKELNQLETNPRLNKSFVLLNKDFLNSFGSLDSSFTQFNCQLSNQGIAIVIPNGKSLSFKTNNNIINQGQYIPAESKTPQIQNQNIQEKYDSELLKNLIRFPFFKKELKLPKNKLIKVLNIAYLVKKEVIENLIELYELKETINILDNNNLLNGVEYDNYDIKYPNIIGFLNKKKIDYINKIKGYESQGITTFKENEKKIPFKNLIYQQGLMYLYDFQIIDQGLAIILSNKFNKTLTLIQVNYLSENNKIFLSINLEQTYIYEIVSMNPNGGNIIVEYLIGVINANIINNNLNSLVCNFILNFGVQRLINSNGPIPIGNNNSLILYPINITRVQNINPPHQVKISNTNINNGINQPVLYQTYINNNRHFLIESTPPKEVNISQSFNKNLPHLGTQNMNNQAQNKNQQQPYLINRDFLKIMKQQLNLDNNNQVNPPSHGNPTDFQKYKIDYANDKGFAYPTNFDIINKETLDKICIYLNKVPPNTYEEIYYIQINEGFIFMPKNSQITNQNNLIYLYLGDIHQYNPYIIIKCIDNKDRNNKFNSIREDQAHKNFIQNLQYFINKYRLSHHLINNQSKTPQNPPPVNGQVNNPNTTTVQTISDRLKVMLLLAVSQIYDYPENKWIKIYLINPQWLEQYKYKDIKSLVSKESNEITKLWNYSYDLNSLSKIIPYLNKEKKLQKYDSNMNFDNPIHNPNSDPIILQDKYIDIYRKFVIVNEPVFKLLQIYFKLPQTNEEIFYIHKKGEEDLIILKNHPIYNQLNQQNQINQQNQVNYQNSIFSGIIKNIKTEENKFDIKYIFDYKDQNILVNEINILSQYNIPNYISNRTGLSPQNNNEMISPIFDNNHLIGNCFRYKTDFNYKDYINYFNILSNIQLWTVIYLYSNSLSIKTKLMNINYNDEEFYLIKKEVANDISKENNYSQLNKYFKGKINPYPGDKEIYNIIRQLPQNQLADFINNLKQTYIPKALPTAYQIEFTSIPNPNNQNEPYMILKDFVLVEKQLANIYLKEKYPYYILKCSLIGNNMIVFHYPVNKFNNKNYMLVVSKIDENNNFINEYLLIYKHPSYVQSHFAQAKYQLINHLNSLAFMNKTAPIVVNGYQEIGTIIDLTGKPPVDDFEYFPPNPLDLTDIIYDFTDKPLIGKENIGATCYMNATLQCLCNIRKFVSYFKYNKHLKQKVKEDINREFLRSAFKLLIEKLYPFEYSKNSQEYSKTHPKFSSKYPLIPKYSYPPKPFKDTISRMNPLFQGVAANDAKDLVNFLIMTLHQELNKAPPEQIIETGGNMFQEQTNKMVMFNKFIDNFKKTNQSIISDLFYALNCNITQCTNCQTMSYNFQIYFFLIFPLEEVRKFKLMNNNNFNGFNNNFMTNFTNNGNNNIVDIYDCFNYDKRINFMTGDNSMYCNYCKQTCGSQMCTVLTSGPEILIIILNRGKGIEFNVKINFYLDLDLSNYIELKQTGCQYELFGVVTHIGESGMGGHFIAYSKSFWTDKWYKFNDAMVDPVNDFKKEVIDFAMPYLLFYQKKNINGQ